MEDEMIDKEYFLDITDPSYAAAQKAGARFENCLGYLEKEIATLKKENKDLKRNIWDLTKMSNELRIKNTQLRETLKKAVKMIADEFYKASQKPTN